MDKSCCEVQPLSLTSFDSSPSRGASGETVHFAGTAKASPTRGGGSASALTERLSPAAAHGQASLRTTSQSHFVRQLSQRESPWHVGQVYAGRAKHDVSGTVVRCCQDSRQLDKVRCPEAAGLCSKARPFAPYRASGVQLRVARPAKASPFGRGVTEGDGEGKPGTKEPLRSDGQVSLRTTSQSHFVRQLP